jgi:hypothetical protein
MLEGVVCSRQSHPANIPLLKNIKTLMKRETELRINEPKTGDSRNNYERQLHFIGVVEKARERRARQAR